MPYRDFALPSAARRLPVDRLIALVPDAAAAMGDPASAEPRSATAPGYLLGRQRRRRADILRAARGQIVAGQAELNVTALAAGCGMAVQTVYNLAGDRRSILAAAIDEHFAELIAAARRLGGETLRFDALAEVLWYSAVRNPDYMKRLNRAYFEPGSVVHDVIRGRMREAFLQALPATPAIGRPPPGECGELAGRMSALISVSAFEWMTGRIDLAALRERLHEDFAAALRGLVPQS